LLIFQILSWLRQRSFCRWHMLPLLPRMQLALLLLLLAMTIMIGWHGTQQTGVHLQLQMLRGCSSSSTGSCSSGSSGSSTGGGLLTISLPQEQQPLIRP
jgi:uncharacterized membrane protein YgcG